MKILKFPVPIFYENGCIDTCEIFEPTTGTIMETKKTVDSSGYFLGLSKFLKGSILINNSKEETEMLIRMVKIRKYLWT